MRKYCLLFALLALSAAHARAQSGGLLEDLFGNDDSIIEQALKQACVVVRQDYVVKDSLGVPYGSGSLPYFGRAYGIGVVSNGFLWTSKRVRQPWIWDAKYTPYDSTHTAAPYEMAWREVDSTAFGQPKAWEAKVVGGTAVGKLPNRKGVAQGDTLPSGGRLAVFYIEKDESPDSAKVQIATAQVGNIEWEEDGTAEETQIKLKGKQLLGGALFTEHIQPGSITFKLTALYVKTTRLHNPWKLQRLVRLEHTVPIPEALAPASPQPGPRLKKRAKKNKN